MIKICVVSFYAFPVNKFKLCNCLFSVETYLVAVNTPANLKMEKNSVTISIFQQRSIVYTFNLLKHLNTLYELTFGKA